MEDIVRPFITGGGEGIRYSSKTWRLNVMMVPPIISSACWNFNNTNDIFKSRYWVNHTAFSHS